MNVQSIAQPIVSVEARWQPSGSSRMRPSARIGQGVAAGRADRTAHGREGVAWRGGRRDRALRAGGMAAEFVLVFGLGKRERFHAGAAFSAGVAGGKRLAARSGRRWRPSCPKRATPRGGLGADGGDDRRVDRPRTAQGRAVASPLRDPSNRRPHADGPGLDALRGAIRRGEIVGEAVNLARELANTPPAEKSPTQLAARAARGRDRRRAHDDVWDEAGSARSDSAACSPWRRVGPAPGLRRRGYRQGGDAPHSPSSARG